MQYHKCSSPKTFIACSTVGIIMIVYNIMLLYTHVHIYADCRYCSMVECLPGMPKGLVPSLAQKKKEEEQERLNQSLVIIG